MRKILKGDGLSSCDFVVINAQAEPADKYKKENYEFFTLQPSGYK
ncbi:hypothetical protein [Campylobacter sp.]|nr:hypothetical protein [Campylobacter sp.]